MTATKEKCNTCRFFEQLEPSEACGLCRRHTPVVVWNSRESASKGFWPSCSSSDWCGEWRQGRGPDDWFRFEIIDHRTGFVVSGDPLAGHIPEPGDIEIINVRLNPNASKDLQIRYEHVIYEPKT